MDGSGAYDLSLASCSDVKIPAISALLWVSLSLYGPAADFDSFVPTANDLSQVRRSSADNAISGDPNLTRVRSSTQGRTQEREESAVSGRMDWSKVFLADGRRFVLVTHEKDGMKRPTICSSP